MSAFFVPTIDDDCKRKLERITNIGGGYYRGVLHKVPDSVFSALLDELRCLPRGGSIGILQLKPFFNLGRCCTRFAEFMQVAGSRGLRFGLVAQEIIMSSSMPGARILFELGAKMPPTTIHLAANGIDPKLVHFLVENGADVNLPHPLSWRRPIEYARNAEIELALLRAGATPFTGENGAATTTTAFLGYWPRRLELALIFSRVLPAYVLLYLCKFDELVPWSDSHDKRSVQMFQAVRDSTNGRRRKK